MSKKGSKYSPDLKNNILRLFWEEKSYLEITKELNCSMGAVTYYCKGLRETRRYRTKTGQSKLCNFCNREVWVMKSRLKEKNFCSLKCASDYKNTDIEILKRRKIGGVNSIISQGDKRRSKNEIHFYNLCLQNFKNVEHNIPLFNGWDADVIIHDYKIAVLWNGIWHYQKISKSQNLEKTRKRDLTKIKEIIKCGYEPYIIKDMGGYAPKFVNFQFNEFKELIKLIFNNKV